MINRAALEGLIDAFRVMPGLVPICVNLRRFTKGSFVSSPRKRGSRGHTTSRWTRWGHDVREPLDPRFRGDDSKPICLISSRVKLAHMGLVPGTHAVRARCGSRTATFARGDHASLRTATWMAGTSPAMTERVVGIPTLP